MLWVYAKILNVDHVENVFIYVYIVHIYMHFNIQFIILYYNIYS